MSQLIPSLHTTVQSESSSPFFFFSAQIESLNPVMVHSCTDILGSFAQPGCID